MSPVRRCAFTLVELLVVISIIGMLMALLLPAVQAARETGRGNTCRNNMRNLTLAAYQYENRRGHYPGIWEFNVNATATSPLAPSTPAMSRPLTYNLFPDLERNDLFEMYSRDSQPYHLQQLPANVQPPPFLELLVCPSNPVRTGNPSAYVFNVDWYYPSGTAGPLVAQQFYGLGYRSNASTSVDTNGIKGPYNQNNSLAFVTAHDGSATTAMFSENLANQSWILGAVFARGFHFGNYAPNLQRDFFKINALNKGNPFVNNQRFCRPTSNHPQSVNIGFCDSHVRTIRDTIAYRVYAHICSPWGRRQQTSGTVHVDIRTAALNESDF